MHSGNLLENETWSVNLAIIGGLLSHTVGNMQEFTQFVIHHWELWLALALILVMLARLELGSTVAGIRLLSPQEVIRLINQEHGVVIDVRDDEAFAKGHITGAIHMPMNGLEEKVKKIKKYKQKKVIVTCDKGHSAPKIGAKLRQFEFSDVFALKGGVSAWSSANLPLVTE